jgi:hypothetical protein
MAYAKKKIKEITYFPKDYPNFKIIKTFRKPRSPRTRMFACADPEGWFIDVFELKTKTGEVVDNEGWITEKDVEQWTGWYKRLGWEEQKN